MTMTIQVLAICSDSFPFYRDHHPHLRSSTQLAGAGANCTQPLFNCSSIAAPKINSKSTSTRTTTTTTSLSYSRRVVTNCSHNGDVSSTVFSGEEGEITSIDDANVDDENCEPAPDDIEIEIEKTGKNSRTIRSRIPIAASLQTVWNILTDYERLADIIPSLAVSQLLEKGENFARLFQIGEQKLAFGLNFKAKGVVDCYEKDLICLPFGQSRDIEFKMIKGDFQLFEGKWSIEQYNTEGCEDSNLLVGRQFNTVLSYMVEVKPKAWLPVRFVEGRLCREIKLNLTSIRVAAEKVNHDTCPAL